MRIITRLHAKKSFLGAKLHMFSWFFEAGRSERNPAQRTAHRTSLNELGNILELGNFPLSSCSSPRVILGPSCALGASKSCTEIAGTVLKSPACGPLRSFAVNFAVSIGPSSLCTQNLPIYGGICSSHYLYVSCATGCPKRITSPPPCMAAGKCGVTMWWDAQTFAPFLS